MRLLMITRKVDNNDALAGFAYNWVRKIGEKVDKLYVISWQKSDPSGLSENIEIISLPDNKLKKILFFIFSVRKVLKKIDGVFCHMNPEYTILVSIRAKILTLKRKYIVHWYTHKKINWKRRLVERLANKIVTASNLSFRDPRCPDKIQIIGHGIDTDFFKPIEVINKKEFFNILSVGRISPTKDYESIIKAVNDLENKRIKLKIIGDVILKSHKQYLSSLKSMVKSMNLEDQVEFVGWVANKNTLSYYQNADLFINMSGTGSVDKVVLEAMSCGTMVLTGNEAFSEILPKELLVERDNPNTLADKIRWVMNFTNEQLLSYTKKLRSEVVNNHNLDKLADKIVGKFY